jgi:ribosomal protein L13E
LSFRYSLGVYLDPCSAALKIRLGTLWKYRNPKVQGLHPMGQQLRLKAVAANDAMNTWQKRDWKQFYELARRPWQRHRPPRPVYPTGLNRVRPAAGFSLSELDDAGVDLDLAERLGLPVDAGRIGAYGPNVTVLRDFVRSSRQPL